MVDFTKLNLLGESGAFKQVLLQIDRFARCDTTLLISGETGTGKELVARGVHYLSARRDGPFIPINCGAIPDSLIGSELFGHSRGAFTDARESYHGLVAQAERGTLFLDELETLSMPAQVALLRFLQDHEYRPLGTASARTANVRVIGATNGDLRCMVERGEFRRDLLYRMSGLSVALPPLRARGNDVVLLAEAFLSRLAMRYGVRQKVLHRDAVVALKAYAWPGNVRELENQIHGEFLMSDGDELRFSALQQVDRVTEAAISAARDDPSRLISMTFREAKARAIADFERTYVAGLLARTHGNISLAARLSGKERSRLNRLVRKYHLSANEFRPSPGARRPSPVGPPSP